MADLDYITSDELIAELASRHRELIVIRDRAKGRNEDAVFVKTEFGNKSRLDKGYDLIEATEMLHATHRQLVCDFLDEVEDEIE